MDDYNNKFSDFQESLLEVSQSSKAASDEMKFRKPKTSFTSVDNNPYHGVFSMQPLERGYGLTLGNALRRVLLASLPGAAIINIQIDGIQHEFSSIKGVVEDVTAIVLNLKDVVLKFLSDDAVEKDLEIDVTGPKTVTASDIITDEQVEIVNPDAYICRVNAGKLRISMKARKGIGYVSADENRKYGENIAGVIPIDSIYTPVAKVSYKINKVRIQDNPNFEELVVDIYTNGGITPENAIASAAKILIDHFNCIVDLSEKVRNEDHMFEASEERTSANLDRSIDDLDLSVRSYNCLKRAGIQTVGELIEKTEEDMMKIRNLGKKSLKEIKERLEDNNLSFARH